MLKAPEGDVLAHRGAFLLHAFVFCCSVLGKDCAEDQTCPRVPFLYQAEPCLKGCSYPGLQCSCSQVQCDNGCGPSEVQLFGQKPF